MRKVVKTSDYKTHKSHQVLVKTLIVYLLFLSLPVDMINGMLLNKGLVLPVSIAQLYKLVVILLFFWSYLYNPNALIISTTLLLWLIIPTIYQLFKIDNDSEVSLFGDVVKVFRYLMPLFSFLFFVPLLRNANHNTRQLLLKIVQVSYVILTINIFIKYLGFGYPMYEFGDIGSKGFFYAGNEISAILVILSAIIGFNLWLQKKKGLYLLFFLLSLAVGLAISSKTGLFGVLITFLLIPLKPLRISTKIGRMILTGTGILLISPAVLYFSWGYIKNTEMYVRLVYFYNKLDLLTFLLSSRNDLLIDAYTTYINDYSILEKIIGVGQTRYELLNDGKIVEIDFIDIFFAYGIIGLLLFIFLISFIFLQAKRFAKTNNYPYANFVILMLAILVAISSTAGHVFSSGMAAVFIGLLLSLMYIKNEDAT